MTYPQNIIRLAVSGTGPSMETWAWSLALAPVAPTTTIPTQTTVPQAVIDAVSGFHGQSFIGGDAFLDMIKWNVIGPDGRYISKADTVQHHFDTALPGGGQATKMPLQVSMAVSLLTPASRGLAHRGRFFLPYPNISVSGGQCGSDEPQRIALAAKNLLVGLNSAVPGVSVVVASNTRTGAIRQVTGVAVGSRPDIIRSRGASVPEVYALQQLPSGGGGSF